MSVPRQRPRRSSTRLGVRAAIFAVLAFALVGAAAYALWPKERALVELGPAAVQGTKQQPDARTTINMSGFRPADLSVPAERPARVLIVNPDNGMHSDGAGIHQFAIPKLGIDVKVPPETDLLVTIPAAPAGEYSFYCDTCCGGKENPTMRGVLKVG